MVNLDRCNGSCNNLDDPCKRVFVQSKIEDVNLSFSYMITIINQ